MIRYNDGQAARVGDMISIDAGEHTGVVEHFVETPEEVTALGVDGPGLLVVSELYGRVFISIDKCRDDEVTLISRKSA